jgi:hypothetical protein
VAVAEAVGLQLLEQFLFLFIKLVVLVALAVKQRVRLVATLGHRAPLAVAVVEQTQPQLELKLPLEHRAVEV